MPNLYIIAGCNGAGKTTASYTVLPEMLDCKEFINADEIARGLSPFQPEKMAIEAGRIMWGRIKELIKKQQDFAFETTLAPKSYFNLIPEAQKNGYFVSLVFFWLNTVELAKERVKIRVNEGGHFIDEKTITRRYYSGLKNLLTLYLPIIDYWLVIDNSDNPFELIAEGKPNHDNQIYNQLTWDKINSLAYDKR
jgi:predicted ABC-type ATPase